MKATIHRHLLPLPLLLLAAFALPAQPDSNAATPAVEEADASAENLANAPLLLTILGGSCGTPVSFRVDNCTPEKHLYFIVSEKLGNDSVNGGKKCGQIATELQNPVGGGKLNPGKTTTFNGMAPYSCRISGWYVQVIDSGTCRISNTAILN